MVDGPAAPLASLADVRSVGHRRPGNRVRRTRYLARKGGAPGPTPGPDPGPPRGRRARITATVAASARCRVAAEEGHDNGKDQRYPRGRRGRTRLRPARGPV